MKLNGIEVDYDAFNPDLLKETDRFIREYQKTIAAADEKPFKQIGTIYEAAVKGFDRLFGAGMGESICGKRVSARKAADAVCEFLREYWKQIDEFNATANETLELLGRLKGPEA